MARKRGKTVTIGPSKPGQAPLKFKRGALHQQLGVPEGQPIPAGKKQAALSGRLGPLAKKRASFAFKGALRKGRQTARAGRREVRAAHGFNAVVDRPTRFLAGEGRRPEHVRITPLGGSIIGALREGAERGLGRVRRPRGER